MNKWKATAILGGIVLIGGIAGEFALLRGEQVFSTHGSLEPDATVTVPIAEAGVPTRVVITAGQSTRGDYEIALDWSVLSPSGEEIHSGSEIAAYRSRNFDFVPETPGEYTVTLSPNYSVPRPKNLLDDKQRYRVTVFTGDKRFLWPLIRSIPF